MSEIKNEKKKRRHVILSIPALAVILLFFYQMVVFLAAQKLGGMFLPEEYVGYFVAFSGILLLVIHRLWFFKEYKGSFLFDVKRYKSALIPIIVFFVSDIILCCIEGIVNSSFVSISVYFVGMALFAGICEEVGYRVLMMTTMLRTLVKKNSYFPALLVSSLIFGGYHIMNLLSGADLLSTVLQIITATATGFVLGAIFLRTGNILYPIIIHFVHDILSFVATGSEIASANPTLLGWIVTVVSLIVAIGVTIWLLKGHKDDIISLWKERWSIEE